MNKKVSISLGIILAILLGIFFYRGSLVNKARKGYISTMNHACTAVSDAGKLAEKLWSGEGSAADAERLSALNTKIDQYMDALSNPQPGMVQWYTAMKDLYGYHKTVCELAVIPAEQRPVQADAFTSADDSMKKALQKLGEYLASTAEPKDAESVITTGIITDKDY
jgi:hypothetical protein